MAIIEKHTGYSDEATGRAMGRNVDRSKSENNKKLVERRCGRFMAAYSRTVTVNLGKIC